MAISQLEILQLESQDLTRAQAVEQHQPDQGEIPTGAEAVPEFSYLFGSERHDDTARLAQAQAYRHGTSGPAIAERRSLGVVALKMRRTGGNVTSIVEAI